MCLGAAYIYVENWETEPSTLNTLVVGSVVADTLISLTALAVGILGLVGILPGLPPAASYTLIGVSCFLTLTWIALTAVSKGVIWPEIAEIFNKMCCSPKTFREV